MKPLRLALARIQVLMAREHKLRGESKRFLWLRSREADQIVALARLESSEY